MSSKIIEGGYQKGVWGHDRDAYSNEDIEFFNEFLRTVAKHRPQATNVIWDVPQNDKLPKPTLVKE
ncbi:MAG: hypothetical protein JRC53_00005 [Deltaproteobacteria bacterium]|nr:hypothetical protein [Deltaproteobacteria bacterium]